MLHLCRGDAGRRAGNVPSYGAVKMAICVLIHRSPYSSSSPPCQGFRKAVASPVPRTVSSGGTPVYLLLKSPTSCAISAPSSASHRCTSTPRAPRKASPAHIPVHAGHSDASSAVALVAARVTHTSCVGDGADSRSQGVSPTVTDTSSADEASPSPPSPYGKPTPVMVSRWPPAGLPARGWMPSMRGCTSKSYLAYPGRGCAAPSYALPLPGGGPAVAGASTCVKKACGPLSIARLPGYSPSKDCVTDTPASCAVGPPCACHADAYSSALPSVHSSVRPSPRMGSRSDSYSQSTPPTMMLPMSAAACIQLRPWKVSSTVSPGAAASGLMAETTLLCHQW